MKTSPGHSAPADLPPTNRQSNPRIVRALGWVLVLIGPCLSVTMVVVAGNLFDTIYRYGRPVSSAHWHGGPEFTRLAFELFGAMFLLGIAIFAGGIYQVRSGRRHPVLIGLVLLLAAATAYFVVSIISANSPAS